MMTNNKSEQTRDLFAAYGGAVLFSHFIEDIVKLHIGVCRHAKVNGYDRYSFEELDRMTHEQRINELKAAYEPSDPEATETVISALHGLRKIRNLLMHEFTIQVGKSMKTEEGKDQIVAMLNSILEQEALMLHLLQEQNKNLIESTSDIRFDCSSHEQFASCLKSVEKSKIQRILTQLEIEINP